MSKYSKFFFFINIHKVTFLIVMSIGNGLCCDTINIINSEM
ncbi:hypothetical protein [Klebsiella pneumoniae IS10]|nr:hypothetical protein [Klebsiella pneumoniae IS10]CDK95129.1 hypothetical protein [Klebsiella pneumoniae IS33]